MVEVVIIADPGGRIGSGTSRQLPARVLRCDISVTWIRLFCAELSGGGISVVPR